MDSVDSDIHVNRLTAACASETPTLFVTLTCNQKDHPGVAPLMKALNSQFGYQPGGGAVANECRSVHVRYSAMLDKNC